MSDFVYSKNRIEKGKLTEEIQRIYHDDKPMVKEYHGDWGSLAVSHNHYNGFRPFETQEYIFVVIGGPILCFQNNRFLKNKDSSKGSEILFNRWISDKISWDTDLSGPFAIIIINKKTSELHIVTDLMSFIPVYIYQNHFNTILSTHVDVLANISNQRDEIDVISCADFILHGIVTFPYTMFKDIYQINPASVYYFNGKSNKFQSDPYWEPKEEFRYCSIKQAAVDLRKGLEKYINAITCEVSDIAQFISGGEDSRILSALLQGNTRDAFIFLDQINREGKMAKRASKAYGANFNLRTRSKTHYIEILPECSDLVGSGSQFHHAHTFGFHKSCKLNEYSAVFGGLFSDALLKGARIKKIRGSSRFPFLPDIKNKNYSAGNSIKSNLFSIDVLEELTKRRRDHLNYIKSFRNESADEWFELWPSSMNMNIPNLHANRRLFRSYEPFMANDIVKLSASVPQSWKLNRRLFHKAVKPFLKPTKWLLHGDGWLPYYPWYINSFIQFVFWGGRHVGKRIGLIRGNQGPWGEWSVILNSREWEQYLQEYSKGFEIMTSFFNEKDVGRIINSNNLSLIQRVNLMQVLYQNCHRF